MDGFTTFLPLVEKGAKTRFLVLVRSSLATEANATLQTDLMTTSIPTVWVELGPHEQRIGENTALHRGLLYAGDYCQWEDTLVVERERLQELIGQLERAAEFKSIAVTGDFNMDNHRLEDKGYYCHALANELAAATGRIGLEYLKTD
jgi:hypothetical protein